MTLEPLLRDTQHAIRRLLHDWRFTSAAVLILGLGIGANTALFSVINATMFRSQSIVDSARLVDIYQNGVNAGGVDANSYPAYLDIAASTDVFASTTAVLVPLGVNYLADGALRPAVAEHTTATYLTVLGLRPSIGRWFTAAEDTTGAAVVAVISHKAWMRKFGADPSVIGRTIKIEGAPATIVGVGPAGHNGTINIGIVTDFWLPIMSLPSLGVPQRMLERRPDEAAFFVKARLRDGVTVAQAQAAMNVLGSRLASEYPKEDPGQGITVMASRDVRVHPQIDVLLAPVASALLGIVGLVLAIACSNLATLLLVRGAAGAKDVSVRLALGATRRQLVRHLLMESLLLAAAGGVAGCILAWWTIGALGAVALPVVLDLTLDYRVLIFAIALSLITGVAFGLAPALKATRVDLVPTLRDDGERRLSDFRWFTLKNALVVFQVAVSVVLLGGTSIVYQMLSASRSQRVGFAVDGVAMLETDPRYAPYAVSEIEGVYEELRRRVAGIPGVQSAALTRGLPMQTNGLRVVVESSSSGPALETGAIWAGPGYFETLRIPLLFGRVFDERDGADTSRVAIINESMARRHFGVANAVGRRFRPELETNGWIEVVGVVRDTATSDLMGDLVDPTPHLFYRSFTQSAVPPTTVVARTSLDAATLVGAMQQELRALNAAMPAISAKTMAQHLSDSMVAAETVAMLLAGLGLLSVCLAGVGLYAIVAFAVSRRAREIGIRMALGARSEKVVWTVAREVAVFVGVGTAAGLAAAVTAIRAFGLVNVSTPGITFYRPTVDPAALMSIAAFMVLVGMMAAYVPARRAARMDPLAALRRD